MARLLSVISHPPNMSSQHRWFLVRPGRIRGFRGHPLEATDTRDRQKRIPETAKLPRRQVVSRSKFDSSALSLAGLSEKQLRVREWVLGSNNKGIPGASSTRRRSTDNLEWLVEIPNSVHASMGRRPIGPVIEPGIGNRVAQDKLHGCSEKSGIGQR